MQPWRVSHCCRCDASPFGKIMIFSVISLQWAESADVLSPFTTPHLLPPYIQSFTLLHLLLIFLFSLLTCPCSILFQFPNLTIYIIF